MVNDIGGDPLGDKYALLNAFYFMSYAPFSEYNALAVLTVSRTSGASCQTYQDGQTPGHLRLLLGYRRYMLCGCAEFWWCICLQIPYRSWR